MLIYLESLCEVIWLLDRRLSHKKSCATVASLAGMKPIQRYDDEPK